MHIGVWSCWLCLPSYHHHGAICLLGSWWFQNHFIGFLWQILTKQWLWHWKDSNTAYYTCVSRHHDCSTGNQCHASSWLGKGNTEHYQLNKNWCIESSVWEYGSAIMRQVTLRRSIQSSPKRTHVVIRHWVGHGWPNPYVGITTPSTCPMNRNNYQKAVKRI